MAYTISGIQKELAISIIDIEKYIKLNKIRINKNGSISQKVYQNLVNFYSANSMSAGNPESDKVADESKGIPPQLFFQSPDKRVSIYRDDAIHFLKCLPASSVDVIITDPAYSGMNQMLKLGRGKIIGEYKKAGQNGAKWFEEFHDTAENYKVFLEECYRVLRNDRHIYIMFDSFSLLSLAPVVREVFDVKNVLCWDKVNIGMGHYFRRRHEFILFASKGKRSLNSKNIPDVWKIKRVVRSKYPTQKPTEVFELMLKGSADKDFVVCDPFLGSGSSAIASLKNGCSFIGCDVSDSSVSFSRDRISYFLQCNSDPFQTHSLLGDDAAMSALFSNSK